MDDYNPEIIRMRNLGKGLIKRGLFEINLVTGLISWANEYFLNETGYELCQIQSMTIFNITPQEFHGVIRNLIYEKRFYKYEVIPILTTKKDIVWWHGIEIKVDQPLLWLQSEYLNRTSRMGPETTSMTVALNTVQAYNDLLSRFEIHEESEKGRINELKQAIDQHEIAIEDIRDKLSHVINASERAANEAIAANSSIATFKKLMDEALDNQTTEILRLIGTDAIQDQRLKVFEKHIKNAANLATTEITEQSRKASIIIIKQVEEAKKGISRRITIPIGLVITIIAVIQWFIQQFINK
jgi:hypothetical protein